MVNSSYYVLLAAAWLSICGVQGQCPSLYRRYSTRHTFCQPRNPYCTILQNVITNNEKQYIVHLHNKYRSRIAMGQETNAHLPPAADMLEMEWSDELAIIAQRHAELCRFNHDCKDCRKTKDFDVGQNVFESWTTSTGRLQRPEWSTAIKSWYDEVIYFDSSMVKHFSARRARGVIGHLTQMIWSKTWKVGCGYVQHYDGGRMIQLYTCNYGPGGNIDYSTVYEKGRPCSQCPESTCCGNICNGYPGLCRVLNGERPEYPRSPAYYAYYCDFKKGAKCVMGTPSGMRPWNVTHTLSGSYAGVVLHGGEKSVLYIATVSAIPEMCLGMSYRKGPVNAGDPALNEAKVMYKLLDLNHDMGYRLPADTPTFYNFGMDLSYDMDTTFAISFSVPRGAPKQYFELSQVYAKSGGC